MTSKKQLATRMVCIALLGALAPGRGMTAIGDTASSPLTELEEVRVHGESLIARIEAAEDAFFALYNAVNTQRRYDIACGVTRIDRDSLVMVRRCVPEFRVHYKPVSYYVVGPLDATACGGPGAFAGGWHSSFTGCGQAPGREVYVLHGSPESAARYAAHVLQVIQGEPRLVDKAAELGEMYDELDATSKRYVELKPPRRSERARVGPRGK